MKYIKKEMIGNHCVKSLKFLTFDSQFLSTQRVISVIYILNCKLFKVNFKLIIKGYSDDFENQVLSTFSHLGIMTLKGIWTYISLLWSLLTKSYMKSGINCDSNIS